MTTFFRLIHSEDRATDLRQRIRARREGEQPPEVFEADSQSFEQIPNSPFAYWVSDNVRRLFTTLPPFESAGRTAKQGLATADDFRFVRLWWEVDPAKVGQALKWSPLVKGGYYAPFHADVRLVINWGNGGQELKAWAGSLYDNSHWSRIIKNVQHYFRAGFTWPLRGTRFSAQAVPPGCIFTVGGKMAFVGPGEETQFAALLNSRAFDGLIRIFAGKIGGVQYEAGLIKNIPIPNLSSQQDDLSLLVRGAALCMRQPDISAERSHAFALPAILLHCRQTWSEAAEAQRQQEEHNQKIFTDLLEAIDNVVYKAYGIGSDDRAALEWRPPSTSLLALDAEAELDDAEEAGDYISSSDKEPDEVASEFLSWCAAVAFGRFDVRLATGERPMPREPDPFDPLPVCSPGMLTGDDGLPLAAPPPGYPIDFPVDGILVDDPGHPFDLLRRIERVFDVVFGANARRLLDEAAEIVEPQTRDLRVWLRRSFFAEHLAACSLKPRVAPVFWRLAAGASYSVWIDSTRANGDTLYKVLTDFVRPRIREEQEHMERLREALPERPTAAQRDEYATAEELLDELRRLESEIDLVAPLWSPDRDDGVILNFAPLHRLVPHHPQWRAKCAEAWKDLRARLYDWSHLAMRLWPEQVVPRCGDDRSLAIAHGLETRLWREESEGRWVKRELQSAEIDALICERTIVSVKEALARFERAPEATVIRTRRPRRARTAR